MGLGRSTVAAAAITIIAAVAGPAFAAAQDGVNDDDFARRLFADKVSDGKAYACFVRHYDADHLAHHPLQTVNAMKLLVTAAKAPEDEGLDYSFRLGVDFRHRPGDFDSSGDCGHAKASETAGGGVQLKCSVDCDGGGITVEVSRDDKSVIVRLDSVRIWRANKPDEEAAQSLKGGADDRVFRLDRASPNDCASLVADRKELAAMRHK